MKDLTRIGNVEIISLPNEEIQDVPAKIDTGADSSAIWASKVVEKDQQLHYVLFDKGSAFYTGKVLTTGNYQQVSIKNSFGQTEYRFKVYLKLVIGGRAIRAKFTLANRANNRYPILIGRRTLHGKFLVDVTKSPMDEYKVLMLSTKRTKPTQRFADNLQRLGQKLSLTYAAYDDLNYLVGDKTSKITLRDSGQDISGFDLVHFKTTAGFTDVAAATARYLENHGVMFLDEPTKNFPGTSKLYQYVILESSGLTVPLTVFMLPKPLSRSYSYLQNQLGLPFILKDSRGKKGEYNYLITNETSFKVALKHAAQDDIYCLAQKFVPNDGDYRVLVLGGEIVLVFKRSRLNDKTHLNNTSRGAQATIVPASALPAAVKAGCLAATKLLKRQIAGVDIVRDKGSGLWYCLEVNDGPQLATGNFTTEKHVAFAAFLERKIGELQ